MKLESRKEKQELRQSVLLLLINVDELLESWGLTRSFQVPTPWY